CWSSSGGKHALSRLAGSVAVRLAPQASKMRGIQRLTAAGGALENYRLDLEPSDGILVFKAPEAQRQQQQHEPLRLQEAVARARRVQDVQSANPVFIEPQTGLAR